jgi:hypothetical protein
MVRNHIESFPSVEGHYIRKSSNRIYLGAELNVPMMYQLYLEYYKATVPEDKLASITIYIKVFNEEYNFSFHVPKKINAVFVSAIPEQLLMDQILKRKKRNITNTNK